MSENKESIVGDLSMSSMVSGSDLVITMKGTAELRDAEALVNAFLAFHEKAVKCAAARVVVDVRAVEFMNSSSINAFVRWLAAMKKEHYAIQFLSDRRYRWQRGSLNALATFAVDRVSIVEGAEAS